MTPEDARKLIGGYATGSLSETERQALFHAALEDQDLFDELAREQAMKDLLQQPGARQRLVAALAPRRSPWWKRPLVWSAAGIAAAGALAFAVWDARRAPEAVQIAQVAQPSPPPPARPAPVPEAANAPPPRPRTARPPSAASSPAAPLAEPAAPPPPMAMAKDKPALEKEKAAPALDSRDQKSPAPKQKVESARALAIPPASGFGNRAVPGAAPLPSSAPQAASSTGAAGTVRGGLAAPALVFDYRIEGQTLVLRFPVAGYISIHFSPGSDTIVGARQEAESVRREPLPNNATEADIVFTAQPQTSSGGVSLQSDLRSGVATDPSGTRIEMVLRIY